MAHTLPDTLSMYYTVILGVVMAVVASAALVYSIRTTSFRWVQIMFVICIIQDIETSQFELTQYLEASKIYH